jgi:hypothetical protein
MAEEVAMSDHDTQNMIDAINEITQFANQVCKDRDVCSQCTAQNLVAVMMRNLLEHLDDKSSDLFVDAVLGIISGLEPEEWGFEEEEEEDNDEDPILATLRAIRSETMH